MQIGNEKQILEKWMGVKGKFSVASIADPELRRNWFTKIPIWKVKIKKSKVKKTKAGPEL